MTPPRLILATSEPDRDAAERIACAVRGSWERHGAAPTLEIVPLEELGGRLDQEGRGASVVVLAVIGAEAPPSHSAKVVDALHGSLIPGVVLLPSVDAWARRLATGGIHVDDWEADPGRLGAVLSTLCDRQTVLHELCGEIDRMSSFQGGLHGEMTRLHDELNLAAMIQRELLPKTIPTFDGVEFGVLFRPAGYVSGDIYDVSAIDDDRVGFFLADAVGHGVPAALLSVIISRSLRSTRDGATPSESLARLNEEMIACQHDTHRFATAVAGVVDVRTREVTLAAAGHPPPLRVSEGGFEPIETDGPLLGVFPDQDFDSVTFRLAEDETLLVYSDGFEVAFADGPDIRGAKKAYIKKLCGMPWPTGIEERTMLGAIAALERELDRQSGSLHQLDDLTALALAPKRDVREARRAA